MTEQTWWVLLDETGKVAEQIWLDRHPCDPAPDGSAPAYAWPRDRVAEAPRAGDLRMETFVPGIGWGWDIEKARAAALADIDRRRLARLRGGISGNPAHSRKREETGRVMTLPAGQSATAADFPWLAEEATSLGITIEEAAARVSTAINLAEGALRAVEAAAIVAKAAVRAAEDAPTIIAARDAFAQAAG